jgi:hypothetical protein
MLSLPEDQKGDVKELRDGYTNDRVGGDLYPSSRFLDAPDYVRDSGGDLEQSFGESLQVFGRVADSACYAGVLYEGGCQTFAVTNI